MDRDDTKENQYKAKANQNRKFTIPNALPRGYSADNLDVDSTQSTIGDLKLNKRR